MQLIHNLGILTVKKYIEENAGFLLTNKNGSYCSFFSNPSSRFQGLFFFDESSMKMYKFIESIEIKDSGNVTRLKNGFYFAERIKVNVSESFLMPKGFSSLIYEIDSSREIDLLLDCKNSYDNREWGRNYEIFEENDCIIVRFTKKTDKREDKSDGDEEFVLYLAIKSDGSMISRNDSWVERHYYDDEQRNSVPFARYVYNALKLKGSKFVFSMSKNKNESLKECNFVFSSLQELKRKEKENFFEMLKNESVKKILSKENVEMNIKVAYINAVNSLDKLCVKGKKCSGIFAGLPWFFQFWARDSLVSLKSVCKLDKAFAEKILFAYLPKIDKNGRLDNLIGQHDSLKLGCADAHGWLFLRCGDLINDINKSKEAIKSINTSIKFIKENKNWKSSRIKEYVKRCQQTINKKENVYHKIFYDIENSLEKSVHRLIKYRTTNNLEVSYALETWMDTNFDGDDRDGARIEIQALRLQMYKIMHELALNHRHKTLENLLKIKIREKFWNGQVLADGLDDFTIRPNIFLAAYAYPELLAKEEWEACFENSLNSLWLDWGGLSTIDKNNPLFTNESTGENIKSYHRGDSWFWINNLAAITLSRINKEKFKKNISTIIEASTEEILWKGCIGCHSELSSAKELSSKGCFNQAWSNAMFIELVDEVLE